MLLDTNDGGQITERTTAPVQASPANNPAEFSDSPGAIQSEGPFQINYVNPADDPRNAKK
jgi:hypothetical protein